MSKETSLVCISCGKERMVIEKGSETPLWLICPSCGQYIYFIGENISCTRDRVVDFEFLDKAKSVLGMQSLTPEVKEYVEFIKKKAKECLKESG